MIVEGSNPRFLGVECIIEQFPKAVLEDELIARLVMEVGSAWVEKISHTQLSYFLLWGMEGQVYFYPGNNEKLGDAFRGYVAGCMGIDYLKQV
jgi:hypothetical protein